MADRYVDNPPGGADAWREVWQSDARYRSGGGLFEWVRRLVRRASAPDRDRQKDFNLATLDLVRDVRAEIAALREDFKRDIAAMQLDMRQADEALAGEVTRTRDLVSVAAKRNDALIAALDQKIESVAARLRDFVNPPIERAASGEQRADLLYRRLEDAMRGEPDIAEYLKLAREHQPVLDIGCGRGEFLIACKTGGIDARGFDVNERSVADLKAKGIDVTLAGIPQCFEGIPHDSVGSILAMHVVEHVPAELLFALFLNAARVLVRGGLLMIETPNAESLMMSGSDFWRDPTHLAPRHPAALTVLARENGFTIEEIRAIHPMPEGNQLAIAEDDSPTVRAVVALINERVFGPQDLRMILRRT
jgi:2-polyprenyl-3-methyl-5-hydroxy-6-metoxy-1,4-benzoquinol methylase